MTADLVGCVLYVILLSGTFAVARKKWWGWYLRALGNLGWAGLGVYMDMWWSIFLFSIVFMGVDMMGAFGWKREGVGA